MSARSESSSESHGGWWEIVKIVVQALVLALFVRVFFYQPFNIPSGSMKGTLLVGDYLFVSKLSYGYSQYSFPWHLISFKGRIFAGKPNRGDIVVFKLPRDNSTDYIKRVIGLPGDTIQMQSGVLYINGKAVSKKRIKDFVTHSETGFIRHVPQYEETLPNGVKYRVLDEERNGPMDSTGVYKVPPGHYFMMGDNRDNSTDSRAQWDVGYVPYDNLVGRAEIIFFSADTGEGGSFHLFQPWSWPGGIRWSRFFHLVR